MQRLLGASAKHLEAAALNVGLDARLAKVIQGIFFTDRDDLYRHKATRSGSQDFFGILDVQYFPLRSEQRLATWRDAVLRSGSGSEGITRAIYLGANFVERGTKENAQLLLEHLGGVLDLELLPSCLREYFANDFFAEPVTTDSTTWLRKQSPGAAAQLSIKKKPEKNEDWVGFLTRAPGLAVFLLDEEGIKRWDNLRKFVRTPDGAALFVKVLLDHPELLAENSASWGAWLKEPTLGALVRPALLQCPDIPVARYHRSEVTDFELDLPAEAGLLPHIVSLCVDSARRQISAEGTQLSITGRFGVSLMNFIPALDALESINYGSVHIKRVRAAVAVIRLAHPKSSTLVRPTVNELKELYDESEGFWFLPALGLSLTDQIYKEDPVAIGIMSALMEASRVDYRTRKSLDWIIQNWREMARSPVQDAVVQGIWR
jgi:hypothetical protein